MRRNDAVPEFLDAHYLVFTRIQMSSIEYRHDTQMRMLGPVDRHLFFAIAAATDQGAAQTSTNTVRLEVPIAVPIDEDVNRRHVDIESFNVNTVDLFRPSVVDRGERTIFLYDSRIARWSTPKRR